MIKPQAILTNCAQRSKRQGLYSKDFTRRANYSKLPAFSRCVEYHQNAPINPDNLLNFHCGHEFCIAIAVIKNWNENSRYRENQSQSASRSDKAYA
ncbi:hypothetical protein [Nostoc sp. FACHB-133]|uniref:hypothetical protein n=1 Tax=Nostoc sp. FACHB-133 TaxID=2692835 RepID=UPI001687ECEC|nr:hypothetical protein [Nostoc sp. FACHB-133]MBD2526778.1 hypothetical protein [Nostoc sp. FACHB-133]